MSDNREKRRKSKNSSTGNTRSPAYYWCVFWQVQSIHFCFQDFDGEVRCGVVFLFVCVFVFGSEYWCWVYCGVFFFCVFGGGCGLGVVIYFFLVGLVVVLIGTAAATSNAVHVSFLCLHILHIYWDMWQKRIILCMTDASVQENVAAPVFSTWEADWRKCLWNSG